MKVFLFLQTNCLQKNLHIFFEFPQNSKLQFLGKHCSRNLLHNRNHRPIHNVLCRSFNLQSMFLRIWFFLLTKFLFHYRVGDRLPNLPHMLNLEHQQKHLCHLPCFLSNHLDKDHQKLKSSDLFHTSCRFQTPLSSSSRQAKLACPFHLWQVCCRQYAFRVSKCSYHSPANVFPGSLSLLSSK